jgi:hypothetical protein
MTTPCPETGRPWLSSRARARPSDDDKDRNMVFLLMMIYPQFHQTFILYHAAVIILHKTITLSQ